MCASNSPCRSPPRSGSSAEDQVENARFHQQHPVHQPPYIYYPPPVAYPPLNPYGPYGPYHSGGYYSHPYCTEPAQEPKSSGSSLIGVILFVILALCVISVILYRFLPRDSRRRLDPRLPILTHPPAQVNLHALDL
ncbi:uncharacterized protein LOC143361980 [Halictus rubicundus]|uniref:uncharacterized protein LOC143361980 n=1 Tax=Halictus rubicundus TaxID=77578 RepID=UPI0040363D2E